MKSISLWVKQRRETEESLHSISCVVIIITVIAIITALLSTCYVPSTVLTTFPELVNYYYQKQTSERGIIIIFILQMRKLWLREILTLGQDAIASEQSSQNSSIGLPDPDMLCGLEGIRAQLQTVLSWASQAPCALEGFYSRFACLLENSEPSFCQFT